MNAFTDKTYIKKSRVLVYTFFSYLVEELRTKRKSVKGRDVVSIIITHKNSGRPAEKEEGLVLIEQQ